MQTVTILNQKNLQQSKLTGKVIRVQSMSGNPRSILLPVSVKDLRTIKIINTPLKKAPANIKLSSHMLQNAKKVSIKNNNIIYTQAGKLQSYIYVNNSITAKFNRPSHSESKSRGISSFHIRKGNLQLLECIVYLL